MEEYKDMFENDKYKDIPYSVAWIDCFAKNDSIGKSLIMLGEFKEDKNFYYKEKILHQFEHLYHYFSRIT